VLDARTVVSNTRWLLLYVNLILCLALAQT
jgi:hypothetical protein